MGHSSLLGIDIAPARPAGTGEDALGPSELSDSGSDSLGGGSLPAADPGEPVDRTLNRDQAVAPIEGTGEDDEALEPADLRTDRIVRSPDEPAGVASVDDTGGQAPNDDEDDLDDEAPHDGS